MSLINFTMTQLVYKSGLSTGVYDNEVIGNQIPNGGNRLSYWTLPKFILTEREHCMQYFSRTNLRRMEAGLVQKFLHQSRQTKRTTTYTRSHFSVLTLLSPVSTVTSIKVSTDVSHPSGSVYLIVYPYLLYFVDSVIPIRFCCTETSNTKLLLHPPRQRYYPYFLHNNHPSTEVRTRTYFISFSYTIFRDCQQFSGLKRLASKGTDRVHIRYSFLSLTILFYYRLFFLTKTY